MSENVLKGKSYQFAIRVVKLSQYLHRDKKEKILSGQIMRSGTAIGALVAEAHYAQSKRDFISKLSIALKEAHETQYWLCLLKDTDLLELPLFESLFNDLTELLKLLTASVKTAKKAIEA